MFGALAQTALVGAAVVGTAAIIADHDAHFHHAHCGHYYQVYDGRPVYYYNGGWEYYDNSARGCTGIKVS